MSTMGQSWDLDWSLSFSEDKSPLCTKLLCRKEHLLRSSKFQDWPSGFCLLFLIWRVCIGGEIREFLKRGWWDHRGAFPFQLRTALVTGVSSAGSILLSSGWVSNGDDSAKLTPSLWAGAAQNLNSRTSDLEHSTCLHSQFLPYPSSFP